MGIQIHEARPLILQMKENEAQRGAMTCFKAAELSAWQSQASLPGGSPTIKNQTNVKTCSKHRQAPLIVRQERFGGGGDH